MPVIEQKTTNKNKVDFDLNRLDKSKTTIFSKYPFFYARKQKRGENMASYAFATLQARQALQELWEQGKTVKDMAVALDVPLSTLYTELRRGRSGVRLPDQRLQYDASLAQLRMQQELERRGKQSR